MVCREGHPAAGLSPTSLLWPSTVLGEIEKTPKHSARLLQQAFIPHYPRQEFLTEGDCPPQETFGNIWRHFSLPQ